MKGCPMLHYPWIAYSDDIEIHPLFDGLKGDPFFVDLSPNSPYFDQIDVRDQPAFQRLLDKAMQGHSWGVSAYLENREMLLGTTPQFSGERRFFHLGLDVILPRGTPVHAPLAAIVAEAGYEAGDGNYGGYVLLRHEGTAFAPFYTLYGHLARDSLPAEGQQIEAGEAFARIGDFHENGYWFFHVHFQVITQAGLDAGFKFKGDCTAEQLTRIDHWCPSPLPLFRK